ncbi:peptidoglycan DD-metalloendopeptidase family protein [bacterium]|nr:peptidoglycan DD-metalloendopeptidase family protein [bacterium]
MPQTTTQERNQADSPEISAFRYTASSESEPLTPLNLNGLRFGVSRKTLSDRLLSGIRFLVSVPPKPTAEPSSYEARTEDLGVFRYQIPLSEYRNRRRASAAMGRRVALVGGLAVSLPLLAFVAWKNLPAQQLSASPKAAVAPVSAGSPAPEQPIQAAAEVAGPSQPKQAAEQTGPEQPQQVAPAPTKAGTTPAVPLVLAPTKTYRVVSGDTISEIAKAHRITRRALRAANGFGQDSHLKVGQTLLIPIPFDTAAPETPVLKTQDQLTRHEAGGARAAAVPAEKAEKPAAKPKKKRTRSTTYEIQDGDTLSGIADKYDLRVADLVEANDIDFHTRLKIGRKIVIPATPKADDGEGRNYRKRDKRKVASRGLLGDLGRAVSKTFLWPTAGRLSSGYGYRGDHFHSGLDITNHVGAPIRASKAGVVVTAGWDGAYGKTVDIRHADGVVTRYAHCSKIMVSTGDRVGQGETIALVGETGRATGPHVHYEVRVNGRPVDPKKFI